jgi:hypothetical protein
MADITSAILSLQPNAKFAVENDVVIWLDEEITEPTSTEISNEIDRLQAEYDNNQYARDRAIAYPALAEQFDKLWHDINNGTLDNTGAFYTALKTVKDDNPKPGE